MDVASGWEQSLARPANSSVVRNAVSKAHLAMQAAATNAPSYTKSDITVATRTGSNKVEVWIDPICGIQERAPSES